MHGGLDAIKPYVDQFVEYAKTHPMNRFLLTRVGCGIAGFKDRDMANLFKDVYDVPNIAVPKIWLPYIIPIQFDSVYRDGREKVPNVITEDILKDICKRHLYEIGAGIGEHIPEICSWRQRLRIYRTGELLYLRKR
jgi:hypothetical protein